MKKIVRDDAAYAFIDPVRSSDMHGAYRAMGGIEHSLTLVHSAVGCYVNLQFIQNIHEYDFGRIATTGLTERDVVYGAKDKLEMALEKATEVFDPSIIGVLGSTLSCLIGEDVSHTVSQTIHRINAQRDKNIPIIYVDTSMLKGDHITGFNQVLEALVQEVMDPPKEKKERTVNIFGLIQDLPNVEADTEEIRRLLKELGIAVNAFFLCHTTIEEIRRAPEARLNIMLSEVVGGVSAAKKMAELFGVPMIVTEYPIGRGNTIELLRKVTEFFGIEKERLWGLIEKEINLISRVLRKVIFTVEEVPGMSCTVLADSTQALAFTRYLVEEWGIKPLFISFTTHTADSLEILKKMEEELNFETTVFLNPSYDQIRKAFSEYNPLFVFGNVQDRFTIEQLRLTEKGTVFIQIAAFPSTGQINIFSHPFAGFRGVIYLAELVINGALKLQYPTQTFFEREKFFEGY